MKLEISERLYVEQLLFKSMENGKIIKEDPLMLDRLTGDAGTRRYYRVQTKENGYVICLDNPEKELEKNDFIYAQEFLSKHGLRVPQIYDYNLKQGFILEEDLGDTTLLLELANCPTQNCETKFYQDSIDLILRFQQFPVDQKNLPSQFFRFFDFEKLYAEIQFSTKYFIDQLLQGPAEAGQVINESFQKIVRELAQAKVVFTHRDFHSRNLMLHKNELCVIDFQDARLGIPLYDLVSLLEDCYYELGIDQKENLKLYYFERAKNFYHFESYEQFNYWYDLMTLQRVYKAIGSFSYIFAHRKDQRYLKYIGFAMEKLKRIFYRYDEFKSLRQTLFSIYYAS